MTFTALAIACGICVVAVAAPVPAVRNSPSQARTEGWDRSAIPVLLTAGGGFFALVRFYAVFTFIVPISGRIAGLAAADMPGVLLASGIGGLIGVLLAGRISDRWPSSTLPITTAAMAVSLAGMGFARNPITYLAAVTAWGALIGVLPVVLQANVMRAASATFRNTAGSILVTVLNLGIGAGAALGSAVSASASLPALPFIAAATSAIAVVPLAVLRSSASWHRREVASR